MKTSLRDFERNVKVAPFFGDLNSFESPDIEIESLTLFKKEIFVVRDDLLPGGTKQRGALNLIKDYKNAGFDKIIYASPFCGYAQIALAYSCQKIGIACKIFCEEDKTPGSSPGTFHSFSKIAQKYGAEVEISKSLGEAEELASLYVKNKSGYFKIPLGFNCPAFYRHYKRSIRQQWKILTSKLGKKSKDPLATRWQRNVSQKFHGCSLQGDSYQCR